MTFFTVGRQNWLKFVEEDLKEFIAQGGAKVRFVNGDYGDGKTHFMSIIRELALQQQFAASFVVLTRNIPIHKFEVVYQEIALQLQGNFKGVGIRALLEHWIKQQQKSKLSHKELLHELSEVAQMDLNFVHALVGLLSPDSAAPLPPKRQKSQNQLQLLKKPKKSLSKKILIKKSPWTQKSCFYSGLREKKFLKGASTL